MKEEPDEYTRSTDGARMIAISPGCYVNEAVLKNVRVIGSKPADKPKGEKK